MTNSDLSARARTIIALMDQQDEIKQEIADRFEDAKNAGFTTSALRKAIKRYRMDPDKRARADQEDEEAQLYLFEIEGRSMREAAE